MDKYLYAHTNQVCEESYGGMKWILFDKQGLHSSRYCGFIENFESPRMQ